MIDYLTYNNSKKLLITWHITIKKKNFIDYLTYNNYIIFFKKKNMIDYLTYNN